MEQSLFSFRKDCAEHLCEKKDISCSSYLTMSRGSSGRQASWHSLIEKVNLLLDICINFLLDISEVVECKPQYYVKRTSLPLGIPTPVDEMKRLNNKNGH